MDGPNCIEAQICRGDRFVIAVVMTAQQLAQDMKIVERHISQIQVGDAILHEGEVRTLSACSLKHDRFIGTTIWGDSYHSGHKPVKVVALDRAMPVKTDS